MAALLVAGGMDSLSDLQSAGLMSGLLFTAVISAMCESILKFVKVEIREVSPGGPEFACGIFDCIGARPFKSTKSSVFLPSSWLAFSSGTSSLDS